MRFKLGLLIGFALGWAVGKDVLITFFQGLRKPGSSSSTGSGATGSSFTSSTPSATTSPATSTNGSGTNADTADKPKPAAAKAPTADKA